jgi:hypothetical protein
VMQYTQGASKQLASELRGQSQVLLKLIIPFDSP